MGEPNGEADRMVLRKPSNQHAAPECDNTTDCRLSERTNLARDAFARTTPVQYLHLYFGLPTTMRCPSTSWNLEPNAGLLTPMPGRHRHDRASGARHTGPQLGGWAHDGISAHPIDWQDWRPTSAGHYFGRRASQLPKWRIGLYVNRTDFVIQTSCIACGLAATTRRASRNCKETKILRP
jgi:hypothetical protein